MSVFSDFQKAWAQRFPNCELPQAWEEDVRANLVKHRQKAATLREELEKEEFYVEYLENLLADVERVKRIPSTSDDGCNQVSITGEGNQSDRRGSLVDNVKHLESNYDRSARIEGKSFCDGNRDIVNKNCQSSHIVRKPEVRDHSSYVTVIEVSGYSAFTDQANEPPESPNDVEGESTVFGEGNDGECAVDSPLHRKKPPAPPKKPRKSVPVQPVTPVKKTFDKSRLFSDGQDGCHFESAFTDPRKILVKSLENLPNETSQSTKTAPQVDSSSLPYYSQSEKPVYEKSELTEQEMDKFYSEENIYDTVAPDEGYMPCSENTSRSGTLDSGRSLDDSEGDYIMLPQTLSREMSQESSGSQTGVADSDVNTRKLVHDETSPEYATYMNIDYFLQQNIPKFRVPSQEEPPVLDSDDEDTYLVRSFSSDHEIDNEVTTESADYDTVATPPMSGPSDDVFDLDPGKNVTHLVVALIGSFVLSVRFRVM